MHFVRTRSGESGQIGALVAVSIVTIACTAFVGDRPDDQSCRPVGAMTRLAEVPEASGLAVSRRVAGRLWTINDSSDPVLFALDERGAVTGRVRVTGATVDDWEAIASGPCAEGSCLFVGDIGDNDADRRDITIYRVPEPSEARGASAPAQALRATYPDGPQNAEALLVTPKGDVAIVTKGDHAPPAMFLLPRDAGPDRVVRLVSVGRIPANVIDHAGRITDGAISPDGTRAVLRTNSTLLFLDAARLLQGTWSLEQRVDVTALGEPQGEGVALATDGSLFLTGEGGNHSRPGTFLRVTCAGSATARGPRGV